MADKPSYKQPHEARKKTGSAEMTIEAAPPTSFSDKSLPSADQERFPGNTISPESGTSDAGAKVLNTPTRPGEWAKSDKHSDMTRT
jgi:hypothetical protein